MSKAFIRPAEFDPELFRRPASIDRGAPFWSWNGALDRTRLLHQLEVFQEMGMGGAHLHPRTGLATPYLGEEFMAHVRAVTAEAARHGMKAWLYDEDRWPSGFAGGFVTSDERFRLRHLRITRRRPAPSEALPCPTHHGDPLPLSQREFVTAWALTFENGFLADRRVVPEDTKASSDQVLLFAYLEVPPSWTWFNNTQYVDTLNPEAIRAFIEATHERYAEAVGDQFGSVVPAIFTDEPLFRGMELPRSTSDARDVILSWTDDLPVTYREAFSEDLLEVLPDVLFDRADGRHNLARWRFHNHHTDRFAEAFAAQLGRWCQEHGIALTGHMMAEPSLGSQTTWIGEAMRSLRHFQLPGIDMLCDRVELTTAKQAQSAARQSGAPGTMSELYGVTNWDFPFSGHKRQGDWQAALGVITRVPHLTWYQMSGEAKRDYPASIGEHAPWWRRYRVIEDHFARVNVALKSGRPRCRVAMIHPIESYWLVHGPAALARERERLETGFSQTLHWLLEDLVDVDFISEADLAERVDADGGNAAAPRGSGLVMGHMSYDAVVVPPCITLRGTTLTSLAEFAAIGGTVIVIDGGPRLRDAEPRIEAEDLSRYSPITFERSALLESVEPFRDVRLSRPDGSSPRNVVHQVRELPDGSWIVFVSRFDQDQYAPITGANLSLRGDWQIMKLSTVDGSEQPAKSTMDDGWTRIAVDLPIAGHILIRAEPLSKAAAVGGSIVAGTHLETLLIEDVREVGRMPAPSHVELDEENVLVLDRPKWRIDDGPWQPAAEILRVDNAAREALGLPPRTGNIAQPWTEPPEKGAHRVTLMYSILVEQGTSASRLALEDASAATVVLDGSPLPVTASGEWMDIAFTPIAIPALEAGDHRLEITLPFGGSEYLEACYLVGDFGVRVIGDQTRVTGPVRSLAWGDAAQQGLAFYGGIIRYRVDVDLPEKAGRYLRIPHFAGALVDVCWPGEDPIAVYSEPWLAPVPDCLEGSTSVELVCYGTRSNTFGQLHIVAEDYRWWGPQSWRTTGPQWADEYQLCKAGILSSPAICVSAIEAE